MRFARISVGDSFDIPSFKSSSAIGTASRQSSITGEGGQQPILPGRGIFSDEGSNALRNASETNSDIRSGASQFAINAKANRVAEKIYNEAQKEAEEKIASAKRQGGIFSTIGKVVGTALPFAFCDMRLKHDVAPLQSCDVDDELAELAFFVKELRECS